MESFDTPGSVTLRIRIPSGRVVVETIDEPRTEIELIPHGRRGEDSIEQIDITHDEHGGRHVISVEQRDRIRWGPLQISWGGDVEVRVRCPVGAELELSGASADLRAEGRYGKVSAKTASGDIRIGDVDGKLEVKTASGDVVLARVGSENASLVTVSGDVGDRDCRRPAHAEDRLGRRRARCRTRPRVDLHDVGRHRPALARSRRAAHPVRLGRCSRRHRQRNEDLRRRGVGLRRPEFGALCG